MYTRDATAASDTLTPSFALVGSNELNELRHLESLGFHLNYLLDAGGGDKEIRRTSFRLAVGLEALRRRLEGEGRP